MEKQEIRDIGRTAERETQRRQAHRSRQAKKSRQRCLISRTHHDGHSQQVPTSSSSTTYKLKHPQHKRILSPLTVHSGVDCLTLCLINRLVLCCHFAHLRVAQSSYKNLCSLLDLLEPTGEGAVSRVCRAISRPWCRTFGDRLSDIPSTAYLDLRSIALSRTSSPDTILSGRQSSPVHSLHE